MTGPLIAPDALAELIAAGGERPPAGGDRSPAILDVRWDVAAGSDRAGYLAGHIPSAVFVDLDRQLADPPSERGRHPLPDSGRFGADMRAAGVWSRRPVVVYDAATSTAAARAWWLLRYFGHPDVAVLDGGLAAWIASGQPVTSEIPQAAQGDFSPRPGGMPMATAAEVESIAAGGVLLDARGQVEPIDPIAGHIPGARNRPTTDNLDAVGHFRSPSALRSDFERIGVRDGAPLAAYCGSGVTAAHEVLALELAGYRAALYPGSWSQWISDPGRPVATGEGSAAG
jgi:thiosulfate/3-mercaptopyruvate sulfurtransferase